MFPHISKIGKGIGLIITQENDEYSGIDLLELIEEKASFEIKNWTDYKMNLKTILSSLKLIT